MDNNERVRRAMKVRNPLAKACFEYAKGCSCADTSPVECEPCTKAFLAHILGICNAPHSG